jgi:hypothetical protein
MDNDGYPTDDELDALSNFTGTAREFFAAVHDLWSYKDFVTETTVTDDFSREVIEIQLITGGWSGNESVAGVIAKTLVHFMWWQSSERGGLTVYRVPVSIYDTPFESGLGWPATAVEDEAESLREWKANAEITLAENKRVMDRAASLLEAVEETWSPGSTWSATAPGSSARSGWRPWGR